MRRFLLLFATVFLSVAAFAATTELATWTFTSASYPANKTYFKATGGTCPESTFYLNGSGAQWNTSAGKGYAFTAVTNITLTLKTTVAIPQNTVISFAADMFYNKASNTPVTEYTLTVKENSGDESTTGLDKTSIPLSNSKATNTVNYTTQTDLAAGATIELIYKQTGKVGQGQAFFGNIVISTEAELGGGGETPTGLSLSTDKTEMTFGEDAPVLTLDNPGGVAVTWSSSDTDVATVSEEEGIVTVKVTGVGTTTIKAEETGNASNYAELTLTVNPKPHGLAYETTSYVVNDVESFTTPTLINPNGLTVTYSSSNTDVATVDANTGDVTLTGVFGTTAITATATNSAEKHCTEGSASYTIEVKDPNAIEHVLTVDVLEKVNTADENAYATERSYTTSDGTVYAAQIYDNSGSIQLNKNTASPGIVVTENPDGYILSKVIVEWNAGCSAGRSLEIYGSNEAYTGTTELDATNASADKKDPKGTLIGSLTSTTDTELDVTGDYSFIGIRALSVVIIDKITLVWKRDSGNTSSVESVVVDNEGAVEYFNLQGVRVQGTLAPGIYIRRTATGTSKVAIR